MNKAYRAAKDCLTMRENRSRVKALLDVVTFPVRNRRKGDRDD